MTTLTIGGRECLLLNDDEKPRVLLIQPMGAHERDGMAAQVDMTRQAAGVPLVLAAPAIGDWEVELMPWPDAAMSRREHAGECAGHTLSHITEALIPFLRERYGPLPIVLGGYSLGGLFALWAASRCPCFAAVAAVSPSVWIAGWLGHAAAHPVQARHVYLSLGLREERTRNCAIARVGDNIRFEHELLQRQPGVERCVLEWNEGGHFAHCAQRTARGFAWCVGQVAAP